MLNTYLVRYIPPSVMLPVLRQQPGVRLRRLREGCFEARRLVTGTSEGQIVRDLVHEGSTPLEIKPHRKTLWNAAFVTRRYKRTFLQALAQNAQADISPTKALEMVIRAEPSVSMQLELTAAMDIIAKGGWFSEAIASISFFDQATIAILIAGERTGSLRQALKSAMDHYETRHETMKIIGGLAAFVFWDLLSLVASEWYVQYVEIPKMEREGIQSKDPAVIADFASTIALGYQMNGAWLWLGVAVFLATLVVGFFLTLREPGKVKTMIESWLRKVPLLRQFLANSAASESFSVAASMLAGGVRLTDTIDVAAHSTAYPIVRRYWDRVRTRLLLGDSVDNAMNFEPIRPDEYLLLASQHSSEQLAKVLRLIATERVERAKANARMIRNAILYGSFVYSGVGVSIYIWLLKVKNGQLLTAAGMG